MYLFEQTVTRLSIGHGIALVASESFKIHYHFTTLRTPQGRDTRYLRLRLTL